MDETVSLRGYVAERARETRREEGVERRREEQKEEEKEQGEERASSPGERYGTVVILKTIIRASGASQVSQGRTVTAISIASQ